MHRRAKTRSARRRVLDFWTVNECLEGPVIRFSGILGLFLVLGLVGCGGSPEEGDPAHLQTEKAVDEGAKAAEKYRLGAGKGNPNEVSGDGATSAPAP